MKTYTFIIGTTDDFETWEDLRDYAVKEGYDGGLNYSIFEFDCPADCSEELVTMIGRGYAFSNDWCMDDTFSFLIEGPGWGAEDLEETDLTGNTYAVSEEDFIQQGIDARESQKISRQTEAMMKGTSASGAWNPNDPKNW
jgi:hypothetical protein